MDYTYQNKYYVKTIYRMLFVNLKSLIKSQSNPTEQGVNVIFDRTYQCGKKVSMKVNVIFCGRTSAM